MLMTNQIGVTKTKTKKMYKCYLLGKNGKQFVSRDAPFFELFLFIQRKMRREPSSCGELPPIMHKSATAYISRIISC